jgi:hypothetical protein
MESSSIAALPRKDQSQPSANDPPPPPPAQLEVDTEKPTPSNDSTSDTTNASSTTQQLPPEYQLHEVDLTNPDMDPLEYTFRRYVPVPKAYFWETANESNQFHQNLPLRIKLWHNTIYYLGVCLKKAEAGGEIVANVLGLNSGEFDYVTSTMSEEQWARSRESSERRIGERRAKEEEKQVRMEKERVEEEVVKDVGLSSRDVL